MDEIIGYLTYGYFYCKTCEHERTRFGATASQVPVYLCNIRPYSQTCRECNKLIVDGAKKASGGPLCLFNDEPKAIDGGPSL